MNTVNTPNIPYLYAPLMEPIETVRIDLKLDNPSFIMGQQPKYSLRVKIFLFTLFLISIIGLTIFCLERFRS